MKKRIIPLLLALSMLCGCSDKTELGSYALIEAAAVDFTDGEYRVSALLFSSGGSSGDTIDASQDNVIKVTGEGETLAEAFDKISLIDGRQITLSEMKLLVLGGGFEHRSITPVLNTLFYDMRCSLNMPVCCAESAEMLTDLRFTEGITSAEKPLDMMKNANREGVSPDTKLLDLLCSIESSRPVLLPVFAETKNGYGMTSDEDGRTAELVGTTSVKDGLLTEYHDSRQTVALMLLTGETNRIKLNFFHDGVEQTCEAYSIKAEIIPDPSGATVSVTARFRGRNGAKLSEPMKESALLALSQLVAEAV